MVGPFLSGDIRSSQKDINFTTDLIQTGDGMRKVHAIYRLTYYISHHVSRSSFTKVVT